MFSSFVSKPLIKIRKTSNILKPCIKLFALVVLLCGFSHSFAQIRKASANTMATIITPVILIKEDINFDKTAVSSTDLVAIASMYSQGGPTIIDGNGLKAAAFTIISEAQYLYNISLPATPLTVTSGSYTITLSKFTNNVSSNEAVNSQGYGSQTLYVSAKLYDRSAYANVGSASPTPFDVTVNYN